ncbi:MAG TPA: hypothetical protein DCZ95_04370 [Verrucomicrobia bacterium]|nr:MAG: hypothetical protein A2X46_07670 [Lentisphaerae bacterium GWF2_57_35]HBA83311.1 hypothetical protein [Verrucomicrobiota bacterium]
MKQEQWLIVDTETNGLRKPIYAVEIAAQRMCGWEPMGAPFRRLLNHDVPIDPVAELVHGYSRKYLRENGMLPLQAHREFNEYAAGLPIVAYNISFDWDQVLFPEYQRLAVPISGSKGFCALTLARRVILETENLKLDTLKKHFRLGDAPSHKGLNDVLVVVRLFQAVFQPRLEGSGIVGFENIAAFSRKTPVAKCLEMIQQKCSELSPQLRERPIPFRKPRRRRVLGIQGAEAHRSHHQQVIAIKACAEEFIALCRGLATQSALNDEGIVALKNWIASCPYPYIYPMNAVAKNLGDAFENEAVTENGKTELLDLIREAISAFPPAYEAMS